MVIIRVYYISSLILYMFENFHNKTFLKNFIEEGSIFLISAERLSRVTIVESFPLMVRTKSLSWRATTEQLFSSVLRNNACFLKGREGERELNEERKKETLLSGFLYIQCKPNSARHRDRFQKLHRTGTCPSVPTVS